MGAGGESKQEVMRWLGTEYPDLVRKGQSPPSIRAKRRLWGVQGEVTCPHPNTWQSLSLHPALPPSNLENKLFCIIKVFK